MITNISPAATQYEETVNSLKYANRAKDIKTKVGQNVVDTEMHVVQYQNIISQLRIEVSELKQQLAANAAKVILPAIRKPSPSPSDGHPGNADSPHSRSGDHSPADRSSGNNSRPANKPAVVENTLEAEKLAEKARAVFKERAKFLRKLIALEETVYSLKIDLAVNHVQRQTIADNPHAYGDGAYQLQQVERELNSQIKEKTDLTIMLFSKLRENEEEGREVQQAMRRFVYVCVCRDSDGDENHIVDI
jgi:hypothetical protein